MKFQIGAMSAGDILDRGLKLLMARLPTFYVINVIVLIPMLLLQLAQPKLSEVLSPKAMGVVTGVTWILYILLSLVGSAAILHVISQEFIDRRVGVGDAFAFAFSRFGSLLVGMLLFIVFFALGMLVCLIPGFVLPRLFLISLPLMLIFMFVFISMFGLFTQVIVVEGRGPLAAFPRSKQLTEGYRLRFLGVLILIGIIQWVLTFLVAMVFQALLPGTETVYTETLGIELPTQVMISYRNYVLQLVATYLVSILVSSYLSICLTLFYFDLRIRKEGYDLEVAAQQQAAVV